MKKKAKPAKKSATKKPTGIPSNPELEAVIASEPRDEHAWSVLEDWILETNDPRAPIVLVERKPPPTLRGLNERTKEVEAAYAKLRKRLLGEHSKWVLMKGRVAAYSQWRAGYIRSLSCWIERDYDVALESELFEGLLASPAARVVGAANIQRRKLVFPFLKLLARSPAARSLRSLRVCLMDHWEEQPKEFDPNVIAPFAIDDLDVDGAILLPGPQLARLCSLAVDHRDDECTVKLFEMTFPELHTLKLPARTMTANALASLLPGIATPKLEALSLYESPKQETPRLVEALRASKLLRQLRSVKLSNDPTTGAQHPERVVPGSFLGKEFAHLEHLTVPSYYRAHA